MARGDGKTNKPRDLNQSGSDNGGGRGSSRNATNLYDGLSNDAATWPDKGGMIGKTASVNDDAVRGPGDVPKSPSIRGRTA